MTYVYPAKMFFARLFWNRKPLLLFIVIISLMVTGVCFGCGLISGFNYFFVENNTYALYEFVRAVIGIVISSFIFFITFICTFKFIFNPTSNHFSSE